MAPWPHSKERLVQPLGLSAYELMSTDLLQRIYTFLRANHEWFLLRQVGPLALSRLATKTQRVLSMGERLPVYRRERHLKVGFRNSTRQNGNFADII